MNEHEHPDRDSPYPGAHEPKAYGALIPLGLVLGLVVGILFREPSIGVLAGVTLGVVAAFVLWLRGR